MIVILAAIAIFALSAHPPEATPAQTSFVNDLLVSLFGGVPGLYDSETGKWLVIGIAIERIL